VAREKVLAAGDPNVLAIASDYDVEGHGKPVLRLDDIAAIAGLIENTLGPFKARQQRA